MNALKFYRTYGRERTEELCEDAGTTFGYFKQCMYGHRTFSTKLAKRLVEHSDGEMTLLELIDPPQMTA